MASTDLRSTCLPITAREARLVGEKVRRECAVLWRGLPSVLGLRIAEMSDRAWRDVMQSGQLSWFACLLRTLFIKLNAGHQLNAGHS